MKVKIGNKLYDSFDQPIAVLLTSEDEIDAVKRLGRAGRAFGSFPEKTSSSEAMLFLNSGWGDVTYKLAVDTGAALSSIKLPEPPKIKVHP